METNKQNLSTFRSWIIGYCIDMRLNGDMNKLDEITNEDISDITKFADNIIRFGNLMDVFVKDETTP